MSSIHPEVKSLVKTSRWILAAIFIQATLFAFWGLGFFITGANPVGYVGPIVVFSLMGLATFIYGFRFYHNYTRIRQKDLLAQEPKKRRETLLLIVVIHFLTIEFICVLGIILAIFLQNDQAMYPFYALFNAGLALSIPRAPWFEPFFPKDA